MIKRPTRLVWNLFRTISIILNLVAILLATAGGAFGALADTSPREQHQALTFAGGIMLVCGLNIIGGIGSLRLRKVFMFLSILGSCTFIAWAGLIWWTNFNIDGRIQPPLDAILLLALSSFSITASVMSGVGPDRFKQQSP